VLGERESSAKRAPVERARVTPPRQLDELAAPSRSRERGETEARRRRSSPKGARPLLLGRDRSCAWRARRVWPVLVDRRGRDRARSRAAAATRRRRGRPATANVAHQHRFRQHRQDERGETDGPTFRWQHAPRPARDRAPAVRRVRGDEGPRPPVRLARSSLPMPPVEDNYAAQEIGAKSGSRTLPRESECSSHHADRPTDEEERSGGLLFMLAVRERRLSWLVRKRAARRPKSAARGAA